MSFVKRLFFSYQKSMWYVAQFAVEYDKIGRFVTPGLALLSVLKLYGVSVPKWMLLVSYPVMLLLAMGMGWWLVSIGILSYNNRISNSQNHELMEILKTVKKIEEKIKHAARTQRKDNRSRLRTGR